MNVVRAALSFLIRKKGVVGEPQIEELFEFYRSKKGITFDREKYQEFLDKATLRLNEHQRVLYVCTDPSCLKKITVHPSGQSLSVVAKELGCAVESSGCLWHCEKAPVMTFKSGAEYKTFTNCSTPESWQIVKSFVLTDQAKQQSLDAGATL